MNLPSAERIRQIVTVGVGTLLLIVMGGVLIAGFRLATQMQADITAMQMASGLQTYPSTVAAQLTSLRDRLEARAYAGQALADLRSTVERLNRDMQRLSTSEFGGSPQLSQAMVLWHQYEPVIDPVVSFTAQPYADSDDAGSAFSKAGRTHYADVKTAQVFARENAKRLQGLMNGVSVGLQQSASAEASRLRLLLSAGVLAALVLAAAAGWLQLTRGKSQRETIEAQEQTRDILKTVREGFFLLDADYRIGSVWSDALTRMFGRQHFSGLPFDDLLRDLVPANTLATANKYIKLLWGDRAHENLMKSINPLGQLEISVESPSGGKEKRYLQFDFHRVMGPKGVKHVLVAVGDITSSVMLARELQESQENANQQFDMMLGVMHIDPVQLIGFLDAAETGLKLVNAIMKEPARTDAEFRKKLDGLFRELHSMKGEASALNLMSVAQRVHSTEDMVSELKKRPELSGSDFLPMILKIDDLLAHLRSIRELASRLSTLREVPVQNEAPVQQHAPQQPSADATMTMRGLGPPPSAVRTPADDLAQTLASLAERLAHDHGKKFRLSMNGLNAIPRSYLATLKDVLIQMLRNSAVHGIEVVDVRRNNAKDAIGSVRIDVLKSAEGVELTFEDDGAGLMPEQLKAAAVRKQIISSEEAAAMDTRAAMALIFKAGFSTAESVSMDAGRGIGMDVVAKSVYQLGGKIGVSTNPGKFTRFKVSLPASAGEASSTAVA